MFLRTAAFLCSLLVASAGKSGASEPSIPGSPLLPQQEEILPPSAAITNYTDVTGVFRPSNGALYLKATNLSGFADAFLTYGLPGDYPITGDWNGDGVDTVGIYRNHLLPAQLQHQRLCR